MSKQYLEAIFIKENEHRFICTILINDTLEECYVSCSSKISNYINLENHSVLVTKNNNSKLRTLYTLEAAIFNDSYYYLNLNNTNTLYKEYLISVGYDERSIQREISVNRIVKTDFFVDKLGCVEVKSLLSKNANITFPDKSSKRIREQIKQYLELLENNIAVKFAFISMSKELISFEWSTEEITLKNDFIKAIKLGMNIEAFSIVYEDNCFKLVENNTLKDSILLNL